MFIFIVYCIFALIAHRYRAANGLDQALRAGKAKIFIFTKITEYIIHVSKTNIFSGTHDGPRPFPSMDQLRLVHTKRV